MDKPLNQLFISYSRKDSAWLDEIMNHLAPLVHKDQLTIWVDKKNIEIGDRFINEIVEAIDSSSLALILLSSNYQSSEYIYANEWNHIQKGVKLGKIKLLWILISPCLLAEELSSEFHSISKPKEPLIELSNIQIQRVFADLAASIKRIIDNSDRNELRTATEKASLENTCLNLNEIQIIQRAEEKQIESYLNDSISIDAQSYKESFVGIYDKCIEWFFVNPEIYTFAVNNKNKVVGYINAMPIDKDTYDEILTGNLIDNFISPESIVQLNFPGEFYLYFCSIGVDNNSKNSIVFRRLFDSFIEKLNDWYIQGFIVKGIVSDAVNKSGIKMCEIIGFERLKETSHGSFIYTLNMLPPKLNPTTDGVRKLNKKYFDYYKETLKTD